jgi:hypothetical protein
LVGWVERSETQPADFEEADMAIGTELRYAKLDELYLDPMNPRLGRNNTGPDVQQDKVLELMKDFTLDELAISFLEGGGFWTHEALLATEEELYGEPRLVVIEGNRRLAALMYLHNAYNDRPASRKWQEIAQIAEPPPDLFTKIPYFKVDSREEIEAFLGFRHVTGIKQWDPPEKAEFIAKLIDERGMSYEEVMQRIGSKTPIVRRHYIAYRMLLQIEDSVEGFSSEYTEGRFSVMYLSLRTRGVQKYLQIDILADPDTARVPVPKSHLEALANFALWLFGNKNQRPLFTDSRLVDDFGHILESDQAVEYLERTERPRFEVALQMAGGDEPEIVRLLESAADNIELSLTRVHLHKTSSKIHRAVERLGADAKQLLDIFPKIREKLEKEEV